jgi:hypothetical protein
MNKEIKKVAISSTLPIIKGNFEEIKNELQQQLKQFDLVVDTNSVKTAKKMATQINKLSKEIDDKRKQIVKELSAPIKDFEAKMKELKILCQESRTNLLLQVKKYDDVKLDEVKKLLEVELQNRYAHYEIAKEFQTVRFDDLIIVSNLTSGGALAKKARDTIDERVSEVKKLQEKINTRLLTLEAICFKGGLQAPLTRKNIESFLYEESDDIYLEKLTSLIANEVNRMQEMEARIAKVSEAKNAAQQKNNQNHPTPQSQNTSKKESVLDRFKNAKVFSPKQKMKRLTITATFEIEVKEEMDEETLRAIMLKKFADSKQFKIVPKVQVKNWSAHES